MPKLQGISKTTSLHEDDHALAEWTEDKERGQSKNRDRTNDNIDCKYTNVHLSWDGATDVEA